MSKSDNTSHKEKKTDPSAMKKQSKKESEEVAEINACLKNLAIKTKTSDNHSKKEEKTDPSAPRKQSEKKEEDEAGLSSTDQLPPGPSVKTKTSDNHSKKEEKTDPSAPRKQSEKKEEDEAGLSSTDQLPPGPSVKTETSDNHSKKKDITDPSAPKKQSEKKVENEAGPSSTDHLPPGPSVEEPTPPSDRDKIRVKFLINVPVGVTPAMSRRDQSHCKTFLDLVRRTAFKPEDEFRYDDIAVVFGLNGKESDRGAIERESDKRFTSKITFRKFYFTWEVHPDYPRRIPYRKIREQIKSHEDTKDLVQLFKRESLESTIYFCFFDADTVDFNHVLSSYIDVIHEHKYPTVMSTGYVFPDNNRNSIKSKRDRQVRIITARHFPLGTYYPEANFCVLLPLGEDTLPEKFDYRRDKKTNMESPNLITQVKTRCKAVFVDKNPVITRAPTKGQFHTNPWTWAICAYAHKELELTDKYVRRITQNGAIDGRARNGAHIPLLMNLLKYPNSKRNRNRKHFKRPGADLVFQAAGAVRHLMG